LSCELQTDDGILLNAAQSFEETTLVGVTSCLPYTGKAKTLDEMGEANRRGVEETIRGAVDINVHARLFTAIDVG